MTDKKNKSLLGSFFQSDKEDKASGSESDVKELLQCLNSLSTIGEGQEKKVDLELVKFRKMIKIGSPVVELQKQVSKITNTLIQTASETKNNKLITLFKTLPAEILIDEFIAQSIPAAIKIRLQNYKNTLTKETLAATIIVDLVELIEALAEAEESTPPETVNEPQLQTIVRPMLLLFSQIEIPTDYRKDVHDIHRRAKNMSDLEELALFLEDVSHLILSFIASSTNKFESFLIQLKQRLDKVNECISKNQQTSQKIIQCSDTLSDCVTVEVVNIKSSISETLDLAILERTISKSLETIAEGIRSFNTVRQSLEKEASDRISELTSELENTRSETNLLKQNLQQQRDRALTDPLTRLPNRHAYNERMHLEYNRWRRYKKPLSLVMGDLDKFKQVNDTHGHIAGDTALRETAQVFVEGLRDTDFIARFGGEEFIILMPETTLTEATKTINKLRLTIQDNLIHESAADFKVTMSFGVSCFEEGDTFDSVILRADKAMYRAKAKGRNQVCVQRNKEQ